MTQQQKARAATVTVIGLAFLIIAGRQMEWSFSESGAAAIVTGKPEEPPDPVDTINRMMDAARDGDVEAYLACFSGDMERRLRQTLKEMTRKGFAEYLTGTNRSIKGFAMYEPERISEREVEVRVEYVYVERNEAQQYFLEKRTDQWTIARIDEVERVETLVPYGTPVY